MSSIKKNGVIGMKASVVVMAVGAALSMPAWALDLSIYGVGHLSYDSIDTGTSSSSYLHSNSSRLGFKGEHDLGKGLSAFVQYESGVDLTGNGTGDGNGGCGNGTSCNGQIFTRARDSFVGVKGSFGTVKFGRLGVLNQWLYDYNLFGDQVGDLGNIWGMDGTVPGRSDHAAQYSTPNFGGFSLTGTHVPNQGTSSTSLSVAKVDFAKGAFKLGGAYANIGQGVGRADTKATALTSSYDFGAFNVGGGWQRETDIGVLKASRSKYTLGAAVKVGESGTVKTQYAKAGSLSSTSDTGAQQWAVGYDHAWDKNTTLYVAYAKTKNDRLSATYSAYSYGHGDQGVPALVAGKSPSALSIGIVYKFDVDVLKH